MMKKAAAVTLLVALVAAAAAVTTTHAATMPDDVGGGRRHRGPTWRDRGHHGGSRSPLAGLTECVTTCGTGVTTCMLNCYKPGAGIVLDPIVLPVCLLKCTNDAMVCGSACANNLV